MFQRCSRNMIIPFAIQLQNPNTAYKLFDTFSSLEFFKLTAHTLNSDSSKNILTAPKQARILEVYNAAFFSPNFCFHNNGTLLHL